MNILSLKDAIKLYMIQKEGALNSSDLTSRSKVKPFMLDFIENARHDSVGMGTEEI